MTGRLACIPSDVFADRRLTAGPLRLLGVLAGHADADGWCWPSVRTLAIGAGGVSIGAVRRDLARLRALGYVEVTDPGGPRRSTTYRLDFTAASARSPARAERVIHMPKQRALTSARSARRGARAARAGEATEQTNEQTTEQTRAHARVMVGWPPTPPPIHAYPCTCDRCLARVESMAAGP